MLRLDDVLFEWALASWSMLSVGGLHGLGRWAVAECCWLVISVLSLCWWVVGICRRRGGSLVEIVLFVLDLVMVAVSWWLRGFPCNVGVLVGSGLVSVAVLRFRMYSRMLVVGLRRWVDVGNVVGGQLVVWAGGGGGCWVRLVVDGR